MWLLAQGDHGAAGAGAAAAVLGGMVCYMVVMLAIAIVVIAGMWKTFDKAGKPGWAAIIPIYNIIVLLEIVGRPIWWIILYLLPCVNIVVAIIVSIDLAKSFGAVPASDSGWPF